MAIDRVANLKRCRALGIEPAVVGVSRKSKRQVKRMLEEFESFRQENTKDDDGNDE